MDGFDVNTGEVRTHSSTVATISTQVHSACTTAQQSVSDNAYGMIGQFFAAAIMLASDQVREGILKGVQSFMDVQNGLKAVADAYQQVDETHAQLLALVRGDDKK